MRHSLLQPLHLRHFLGRLDLRRGGLCLDRRGVRRLAAAGASAGFACIAADCCAGSDRLGGDGLHRDLAARRLAARGGIAFGSGTDGVRLATCGTDAGGRGTPVTGFIGGSGPTGP